MKHLKIFYTQDDADNFLNDFDESQSPGIIAVCDELPGVRMFPRPGATPVLNLVFKDGDVLFTRQFPYDGNITVGELFEDGQVQIPDECSDYYWNMYYNDVNLNISGDNWDESISELGINPGDTLVYKRILPK